MSFLETLKKKLTKRIIIVETKFPANKKDINDLSKAELDEIIKNAHDSVVQYIKDTHKNIKEKNTT